jgi:uncharacterized protein YigA (DUF484 family)
MMAESVNDVATVQQNLLKNLDDANAAIIAQARLNREVQQELMSVRMVPFGSLADRLYRIVRQTSKELNKRANLEIKGARSNSTAACSTRWLRRWSTCCATPSRTASRMRETRVRRASRRSARSR